MLLTVFLMNRKKEMRVTVFQAGQSQNSFPAVLLRSLMCDILSQSSDSTNCSKCEGTPETSSHLYGCFPSHALLLACLL